MDLEWPSVIRGPMREDEVLRLRRDAETRGMPAEHAAALAAAYRLASFVAENEFSDGRAGEPLHAAALEFCDQLAAASRS